MKSVTFYILVFFAGIVYSQVPNFHHNYYNHNTDKIDFDGFKYNHQYYETSPKGLKSFLKNNKDNFSPELESILIKKHKNIKTRHIIGEVISWGSWITGGVIMYDTIMQGQDQNGKYDTKGAVASFGVVMFGMLFKELFRPKNRHYYDFINAVNRDNKSKINIKVTLGGTENFNLGLAVNF